MPAYTGTLRELLPGNLGTVAPEVLTFTDAFTWSGAQVFSGVLNFSGATVTYPQDDAAVYAIRLSDWRQADEAPMGITGTSGDHFIQRATNVWSLTGNTPSSSTVTDISIIQVTIPERYVSGETITFRVSAKVDATADTNTLDLNVFLANSTTGAVGSDICATTIKTVTATAQQFSFTITPTALVAGNLLNIVLTTVNNDADGSDGIVSIFATDMLYDVRA